MLHASGVCFERWEDLPLPETQLLRQLRRYELLDLRRLVFRRDVHRYARTVPSTIEERLVLVEVLPEPRQTKRADLSISLTGRAEVVHPVLYVLSPWHFNEVRESVRGTLEMLESVYRSNYSYVVNLARFILWPFVTLGLALMVAAIVYAMFAPLVDLIRHAILMSTP